MSKCRIIREDEVILFNIEDVSSYNRVHYVGEYSLFMTMKNGHTIEVLSIEDNVLDSICSAIDNYHEGVMYEWEIT